MGEQSVNLRNIRLTLSFDGTEFSGWQRQTSARTIQGDLEEKLAMMTGEKIVIHGAGRTDSGVHALAMTAHFATYSSIACSSFRSGLNGLLTDSIKVMQVEEVDSSFHSRISARAKVYQYFFTTEKIVPPHRRYYCAHLPGDFDLEKARECLPLLLGRQDFSCFEATGSRDKRKIGGRGAWREIFSVSLTPVESPSPEYLFEICGDGFLRKMVRNIIGTLIEVGQQRMSVSDFADLLQKKDRSLAGPTAPACGLFLKKVYYDESWLAA
ncbi:MAG: tRNA pseudouridine(38-40) synthase TruA [Proteobacteria bacterium]|nr:tRNA pseudouridine(38-40) synthase TruA [Pseudomonadota bacterium]MBU0964958.1 tRNA pseudouridine(38-40) synthase TruA [Pseudomonadota bacterium]